MKQKLLFVIEDFQVNGAITSLLALLNALKDAECELYCFACSHEGSLLASLPPHVTLLPEQIEYAVFRKPLLAGFRYAVKHGNFLLAALRLCIPLSRKLFHKTPRFWSIRRPIPGKYDVAISYTDGFAGEILCQKVDAKRRAMWIHNDYIHYPQSSETYAAFDRVDLAIGCSQSVVDTFLTQHPGPYHKSTAVIHNIVNVQSTLARSCEAQTVAWKKNATLRILSVGRLSCQKNFKAIPAILYALKQKADAIPAPPRIDWLVIGAGEAYLAQCQVEVQRWHVEDQVRFIGAQANPFPYMKSCDLYIQPSQFEGWPMTTTEARALGCAIVASNLPCFREQLGEEPDCRLASPDNPETFAEQMLLLIRTTTHAPSKMIQRCSPQAVVTAFKKVILS